MLRFLFFVTVVAAILSFADSIWNGERMEPHQYPYTVGLILTNLEFEICGGALISNNVVVTAAHCVDFHSTFNTKKGSKKIDVVLGVHNLFSEQFKYKFSINENNVILHPQYNETETLEFDIALIRLPKSIKESDSVKIVSLPPKNLNLSVGQDIIITGWGKIGHNKNFSDVLQVLNTKVAPEQDCYKYDEFIVRDNICIYTPYKSVCVGDSGSPNYIRTKKGKLILVGVIQRLVFPPPGEEANCERDAPQLYTSVSHHLSWINSELNKL